MTQCTGQFRLVLIPRCPNNSGQKEQVMSTLFQARVHQAAEALLAGEAVASTDFNGDYYFFPPTGGEVDHYGWADASIVAALVARDGETWFGHQFERLYMGRRGRVRSKDEEGVWRTQTSPELSEARRSTRHLRERLRAGWLAAWEAGFSAAKAGCGRHYADKVTGARGPATCNELDRLDRAQAAVEYASRVLAEG